MLPAPACRLPWTHTPLQAGTQPLNQAQQHYVCRVLRLVPPAQLELFDGQGQRATATLCPGATLKVGAVQRCQDPGQPLRIICALPSPPRAAWLVEKLVELGATHIDLAHSSRVQGAAAALQRQQARYARLLDAAARQAERYVLPTLSVGEPLLGCAAAVPSSWHRFVATASGAALPAGAPAPQALVVGPPGGLVEAELAQLQQLGFVPLRLAHFVLRCETAAVAGAAALLQQSLRA